MENKKGQIGALQSIAVTVVIIGLLLGVGFLVLDSLRTTLSESYSGAVDVLNVTAAGVYTPYNSTSENFTCFHDFAVTSVVNRTGTATIPEANYTYDFRTGKISSIGTASSVLWNVTFTYREGDEACVGLSSTIDATNQVPAFLPIVVIIGVVGILLAIVLGVLAKSGAEKTAEI